MFVALVAAVRVPAAGANRVPPQPPTCEVFGTGIIKRPLVPAIPTGAKDKKNRLTISVNLSSCHPTDPFIVAGSVDHGVLALKMKVPSYETQRFLTSPVTYTTKLQTYYASGSKWGTTRVKWTAASAPFGALPGSGDPAQPVVLTLTSVEHFGTYDQTTTLTLVTSLVAPNVYQPNAPTVSTFNVGTYMGHQSSYVVSPNP